MKSFFKDLGIQLTSIVVFFILVIAVFFLFDRLLQLNY